MERRKAKVERWQTDAKSGNQMRKLFGGKQMRKLLLLWRAPQPAGRVGRAMHKMALTVLYVPYSLLDCLICAIFILYVPYSPYMALTVLYVPYSLRSQLEGWEEL